MNHERIELSRSLVPLFEQLHSLMDATGRLKLSAKLPGNPVLHCIFPLSSMMDAICKSEWVVWPLFEMLLCSSDTALALP